MKQFTKEEAIAFHDSMEWEKWADEQIVKLQLFQELLCIPFSRYHQAMEAVLGRPIWTHEFANRQHLVDEYLKIKPAPTFEEILDLIPKDKKVIIIKTN